jgi:hypothetical protein
VHLLFVDVKKADGSKNKYSTTVSFLFPGKFFAQNRSKVTHPILDTFYTNQKIK